MGHQAVVSFMCLLCFSYVSPFLNGETTDNRRTIDGERSENERRTNGNASNRCTCNIHYGKQICITKCTICTQYCPKVYSQYFLTIPYISCKLDKVSRHICFVHTQDRYNALQNLSNQVFLDICPIHFV